MTAPFTLRTVYEDHRFAPDFTGVYCRRSYSRYDILYGGVRVGRVYVNHRRVVFEIHSQPAWPYLRKRVYGDQTKKYPDSCGGHDLPYHLVAGCLALHEVLGAPPLPRDGPVYTITPEENP